MKPSRAINRLAVELIANIFQLICTIFTLRMEAALKENSARLWIVENNIRMFVAFIRRIVCLTDRYDVSRYIVSEILCCRKRFYGIGRN